MRAVYTVNKPGARTPGRTRLTAKITGITELLNATGVVSRRVIVHPWITPATWVAPVRARYRSGLARSYKIEQNAARAQKRARRLRGSASAASARGPTVEGSGLARRSRAPRTGRAAPRARRRDGRRRRQLIARVPRVEKGHEFQERLAVI